MSYNSLGSDLPFFDKKMKLGGHSRNCGNVCFDEQTSQAQIPYRGYILVTRSAPIHIDAPE
jgi:hypothetical protein